MDPEQLLTFIIRPALSGSWASRSAEILLLSTAAQESHCGQYVRQIHGPARGIFQMEPRTHDLVIAWLEKNEPVRLPDYHYSADRLVYDLNYAAILARGLYRSIPEPLPAPELAPCWQYYKAHYNTPAGKATFKEFTDNWHTYVQPVLASAA